MIIIIGASILSLIFGIFLGIKANKWNRKINDDLQLLKKRKADNEVYLKLLNNIKSNKTKFKNRINNTVFITTKLPDVGKVEVVFMMDTNEIAIFQNHRCILTSDNVDNKTLTEVSQSILETHELEINDIIEILGLVFSRIDFEKKFNTNIEEIRKQSIKTSGENKIEKNDIDKIIASNRKKFDIDEILDKINSIGIENLTPEEKLFLKNFNK